MAGGVPAVGAAAIDRHGCGTCHRIAGIPGATGPALVAIGRQAYVAGVVPNEPDWLIAFIMNPQAIGMAGCAICYQIPGITGRKVHVGPPLSGMGERKYTAGVLVNTPENMVRWLMDPPAIDPLTGMPDVDVTEPHARDMAAYLRTLLYEGTSEP